MICPRCNGEGNIVHVCGGVTYFMECPICKGLCLKPVELVLSDVFIQSITGYRKNKRYVVKANNECKV